MINKIHNILIGAKQIQKMEIHSMDLVLEIEAISKNKHEESKMKIHLWLMTNILRKIDYIPNQKEERIQM